MPIRRRCWAQSNLEKGDTILLRGFLKSGSHRLGAAVSSCEGWSHWRCTNPPEFPSPTSCVGNSIAMVLSFHLFPQIPCSNCFFWKQVISFLSDKASGCGSPALENNFSPTPLQSLLIEARTLHISPWKKTTAMNTLLFPTSVCLYNCATDFRRFPVNQKLCQQPQKPFSLLRQLSLLEWKKTLLVLTFTVNDKN